MTGHDQRETATASPKNKGTHREDQAGKKRSPNADGTAALKRVSSVVLRTKLILAWERIWPPLSGLGAIALIYCGLSWIGLWLLVPAPLRVLAIIAFAAGLFYFVWKLVNVGLPDEDDAIERIEDISAVKHRPLTTMLDQPAAIGDQASASERALWQAHQDRMRAALSRLRSGPPERQLEWRDPYALRTFAVLLAFVGFNMAGSDRALRLTELFTFYSPASTVVARLDAWVTPPSYTSQPPIFLTNERLEGELDRLTVPENSVITIRAVNAGSTLVTFAAENGAETAIAETSEDSANVEAPAPRDAGTPQNYELILEANGSLTVDTPEGATTWTFDVVQDEVPTISYGASPTVQQSGALEVFALLKDDYGVIRAEGVIEPTQQAKAELSGEGARPLYDPPKFPLTLNSRRIKDGASKTIRSIVDHPWAGAEVTMTLHAHDEAGQSGTSPPQTFRLPERRFTKPVARAIIEQRRNLALDANYAERLVDIIDVLTLRPEQYDDNNATLITLAAVRRGLIDARDDDALRRVVDQLWELATGIEDGDLSEAERNLREALEALREGIENGASEEELARLMDEARQAMREFMQALAEQAQQNQLSENQNQQPIDPSQTLTPQDLERMLDRIEDLAATGSRDAAQQLLSELQQMMENLQANRDQQGDRGQSQAQQMLNELGDMIRRQQELMDRTFRQQNQQNQQGRQGYQGQQSQGDQNQAQRGGEGQGQEPGQGQAGNLEQLLQDLQNGQQTLADRLRDFMEQMQRNGLSGNQQLGDAQNSMDSAAGELGNGDLPAAGRDQADALDNLRSGAQQLANQMAQGEGQGEGAHDTAEGENRTDPLGRPERTRGSDFGDSVKVPDEIDTQRAREILDAIRRRLGDTQRPLLELDYLERLLQSD